MHIFAVYFRRFIRWLGRLGGAHIQKQARYKIVLAYMDTIIPIIVAHRITPQQLEHLVRAKFKEIDDSHVTQEDIDYIFETLDLRVTVAKLTNQ